MKLTGLTLLALLSTASIAHAGNSTRISCRLSQNAEQGRSVVVEFADDDHEDHLIGEVDGETLRISFTPGAWGSLFHISAKAKDGMMRTFFVDGSVLTPGPEGTAPSLIFGKAPNFTYIQCHKVRENSPTWQNPFEN